jgi:hypothetical protein
MVLTPGQAGDNPQLLPLFAHTRNRPALTRVVAWLGRERILRRTFPRGPGPWAGCDQAQVSW